MRNPVNILDLSVAEIDELIKCAIDIIKNPELYVNACRGKILGTLFFEPSTRTRLSFTSAMMASSSLFMKVKGAIWPSMRVWGIRRRISWTVMVGPKLQPVRLKSASSGIRWPMAESEC